MAAVVLAAFAWYLLLGKSDGVDHTVLLWQMGISMASAIPLAMCGYGLTNQATRKHRRVAKWAMVFVGSAGACAAVMMVGATVNLQDIASIVGLIVTPYIAGVCVLTMGEDDLQEVLSGRAPDPYPNPLTFMKMHWAGEYSVARSFWLNSTIGLVYLLLPASMLIATLQHGLFGGDFSMVAVGLSSLLEDGIAIGTMTWMGVGVFRACGRSRKSDGRKWATYLVQATVILIPVAVLAGAWNATGLSFLDDVELSLGGDAGGRLTIEKNSNEAIKLSGWVGAGDASRVEAQLKTLDAKGFVVLTNLSGRLFESAKIARVLNKHGVDAVAFGGCYEACSMIMSGAKGRAATRAARIELLDGLSTVDVRTGKGTTPSDVARFYKANDVSPTLLEAYDQVSKDDGPTLTRSMLIREGFINRSGAGKNADHIPPSFLSKDDLFLSLQTNWLWAHLEKVFPGYAANAADRIWEAAQVGRAASAQTELLDAGTVESSKRSSPAAIKQLISTRLELANAAVSTNDTDCSRIPRHGVDYAALHHGGIQRKNLDALSKLLSDVKAAQQAAPKQATEVDGLLSKIPREAIDAFGAKPPQTPTSCSAMASALSMLANAPDDIAALTWQHMIGK